MCRGRGGAEFEVLALGRFDGLPRGLDFVAVPLLEFGELGGEGADDTAGRVVGQLFCWLRRVASLLVPELFDASAELGAPALQDPGVATDDIPDDLIALERAAWAEIQENRLTVETAWAPGGGPSSSRLCLLFEKRNRTAPFRGNAFPGETL